MDNKKSKCSVLIVDDLERNRLAITAVLDPSLYELVEADSGPAALELIKSKEFAVILLDVQMPDMDGFETAFHIRNIASSKTTPIIFITASIDDNGRMYRGYEAGAVDYLFKPFDPVLLRSKVAVFSDLYNSKKEVLRQGEILRNLEIQERNTILKNALDAFVIMNAEGNITYWNDQAEKIFGWSSEEVLGARMSEYIIPENYRLKHEEGLKHFLQTGEGPILNKRIEVTGRRKNGEVFPIELTVTPYKSQQGYFFSAFARDISARLEEQKKLQEAIRARDEFISVCSHELKTPVTSMKLHFQLADKRFKKNDQSVFSRESVEKRIKLSLTQLERMNKLIDDMLDVSKIAGGRLSYEMKPVLLDSIVSEVLQRFEDHLQAKLIHFNYFCDKAQLTVMGDSLRLEQVVTNLITNAIKYGDNKPFNVELSTIDHWALLKVQDFGLGIKEEFRNKIFDRFERAISASEISGLGLGLYIVKEIVKAHEGDISVESSLGSGSTFTIKLPLFEQ